jgi:glycerol-3-phosphate dehydrogenase (NAD(P)+)
MTTIAVLGAGSWGTALAILLARNGQKIKLWDRDPKLVAELQRYGCNQLFLPEVPLPSNVKIMVELEAAVTVADLILIAIPSIGFRELLRQLRPLQKPIVWVSKGLEPQTNQLLSTVIRETLGNNIKLALLSGPSFAKEVALNLPTAVVIASKNKTYAKFLINLFNNAHFRPYYSDDVTGVEIGGVVKNVIAIATGISDGLGFGTNARAALITYGLAEITRLAITLGGRAKTLTGLSGLGDLMLTCTDNQSRNRRFGLALGQGLSTEQALAKIGQSVVEGTHNVEQVISLAREYHINMPITKQIQQVLRHEITPQRAIQALFSQELNSQKTTQTNIT